MQAKVPQVCRGTEPQEIVKDALQSPPADADRSAEVIEIHWFVCVRGQIFPRPPQFLMAPGDTHRLGPRGVVASSGLPRGEEPKASISVLDVKIENPTRLRTFEDECVRVAVTGIIPVKDIAGPSHTISRHVPWSITRASSLGAGV